MYNCKELDRRLWMELANSSVNKKYQLNICTLNPISIGNLFDVEHKIY